MSMKKRIEKLEERTGAGKQVVFMMCYEGDDTEPTETQKEAAIADYKAKNPDWKEGDSIVLYWKDGQFGRYSHNGRLRKAHRKARKCVQTAKAAQTLSGNAG